MIDLRYTYVCAHCGGFAELSFWDIEVFDTGTTLTCNKCGKDTVVLLVRPEEYGRLAAQAYKPAIPLRLEETEGA